MGLFSRNYNRDRISVHQLKEYIEANGVQVSECWDNGKLAYLEFPTITFEVSVAYRNELSKTMLAMYPMYYSGPYTQEQIKRIIVKGIDAPNMQVGVGLVGSAFSFSLSIQMNHRYFELEEFDKELEQLVEALDEAGEALIREGILD